MSTPLDLKLYKKAKRIADKTYEKPSAYKSMFISRKYVELGGKYKEGGGAQPKTTNLSRWRREKWVQVIPFLKNRKEIACGEDNKKEKVCRPLVRIDSKTPLTIPELLKMHSKKDLIDLAEKKVKNMKGRVFWKTLKFTPPK